MFKDSLNKVVTSRVVGNTENSRGLRVYIATSRITKEKVILNARSISRSGGGKGIIITANTAMMPKAMKRSVLFEIMETGNSFVML